MNEKIQILRKLMFYMYLHVKLFGLLVLQFYSVKPKKKKIVRTDKSFTLIRSRFSRKIVKLFRNRYEVLQGFTNLH